MGMKLLVPLFWFLGAILAIAGEDEFRAALRVYNSDLMIEIPAKEKLRLADDLLKEWEGLDETGKVRWADKVFLVHFLKAEILASKGMFKGAARELVAEQEFQAKSHGRLEYSTKQPDLFFKRLVELQAQLAAETGVDPLKGAVNYLFEKKADGYMAARFELWNEINSITISDVREGEKLMVVHRIRKQKGRFVVSSSKGLVVPEGKIRDVMKKARMEVSFDENGLMVSRELNSERE